MRGYFKIGVAARPEQVVFRIERDVRAYVSTWRNVRKLDVNRLICATWSTSCRVSENQS